MSLNVAVPCKTCGASTFMTMTKLCDGCWEVEHRLRDYLRFDRGRAFVRAELARYDKVVVHWIQIATKKSCDAVGCRKNATWERAPSEVAAARRPIRRSVCCDAHFPVSLGAVEHRKEDW